MLWGSNGAANTNMPKFTLVTGTPQNAEANLFVNATPSAFVKNQVVGVYGVPLATAQVAEGKGVKDASPGWVIRRSGMGPVVSLSITGGTGYSNNDLIKVTANGCTNTTANVSTNSTGGVVGMSNLTNNGGLFPNSAFVTVAIANSTGGAANGTGFSATATLGGRAGRHHNEVLVSVGSMTSNSTYSPAAFPNS
jgi:hypothetical protein